VGQLTVHLPPTDVGAVIALLTLLAGYIPDRPRRDETTASDMTQRKSRHGDTAQTKIARRRVSGKTAGQSLIKIFRG
jgi:hypothetical protein